MKLFVYLLICLFLIPFNLFTVNAGASDNWIIDGDTVYINDENVYLSATPHTVINDGWVVFELETTYKGKIDIGWGFNTPSCTPHNPQIWRNYTHELTGYHYVDRIGNIEIYNVTGWDNLGIENYNNYTVDYGNINNTYLMNISYKTNKTLIIAFTSYIEFGDGDDYRVTGYYNKYESYIYYETFFDWLDWDADFEIINYEHGGMNTWFLLKDVSTIPNYRYRVRAWMDIPFNTIGKYWWVLKPSNRTIPKAIEKGLFYCLDPWWDSGYTYYRPITIDSSFIDNSVSDFPVLVVIDDTTADKCNGGDSIRFLNPDNTTEYYYEIEKWVDNEDRIVWVKIPFIDEDVDTKFLMYYGNVGASDNQNPPNVWDDNFLAVYHLNEDTGNLVDSTWSKNGTGVQGTPTYEQTGAIGYGVTFDGSSGLDIPTNFGIFTSNDFTLEIWLEMDALNVNDQIIYPKGEVNMGLYVSATQDIRLAYNDGSWRGVDVKVNPDTTTWHYYSVSYDNNVDMLGYYDGEYVGNSGDSGNIVSAIVVSNIGYGTGQGIEGSIDEFRISNNVRNATWFNISFITQSQTEGFMTFGSEQEQGVEQFTPVISNESPLNNSVNISIFPVLSVTINDRNVDDMSITWSSNFSGTWQNIGYVITDVPNGTYYQKFTEFAIYDLKYYYNVSVFDGSLTTIGNGSCFTTVQNETEQNGLEGDILIEIEPTQFVIFVQLFLLCVFLWIGYTIPAIEGSKKSIHYMPFSGGLFIIFGGLDFISFAVLINNEYSLGIVGAFLTMAGIILLLYGVLKAFYYE